MTFILIMSTMERSEELERFFQSVATEQQTPFKIYLCDQNDGPLLDPVLASWKSRLGIEVVHSDRGLSRGRNAAIKAALREFGSQTGKCYVAFPDDDCWYTPKVLSNVLAEFEANPGISVIAARSITETGRPTARSSPEHAVELNRHNLFRGSMAISYCIFLELEVVERVGLFDPTLGVGSGTVWGAGEESDYLLRALELGYRLKYLPDLKVVHPDKTVAATGLRFLAYARGHGRVLRLNGYHPWVVAKDVFVALVAFVIKSLAGRRLASAYLYRALGYLQGYWSKPSRPAGFPFFTAQSGDVHRPV
jgi:GT2 family glycosyltransferase